MQENIALFNPYVLSPSLVAHVFPIWEFFFFFFSKKEKMTEGHIVLVN